MQKLKIVIKAFAILKKQSQIKFEMLITNRCLKTMTGSAIFLYCLVPNVLCNSIEQLS